MSPVSPVSPVSTVRHLLRRAPGARSVAAGPRSVVAGVAVVGLLLTGCGESSSAADAVPELSDRLGAIDDAIVDGDYDEAAQQIDELIKVTRSSRRAGDLDAEEADDIVASASTLLSALPADEEEPEPSETTTPSPSESESESESPSESPSETASESPTESPSGSPSETASESPSDGDDGLLDDD